jgi:hypothetical protein
VYSNTPLFSDTFVATSNVLLCVISGRLYVCELKAKVGFAGQFNATHFAQVKYA